MNSPFTQRIIAIIKAIPKGKIATYGMIAALAGNPRGARQVVRILHTFSSKEQLPWQRVINSKGKISLPNPDDYLRQRELLEAEGIEFEEDDRIDLDQFLWHPIINENDESWL
ncbi:MAG: MGMT family protein [Spirochaetes bacterium]|nr:MGMT family protein [Spirochaetota bacterium]